MIKSNILISTFFALLSMNTIFAQSPKVLVFSKTKILNNHTNPDVIPPIQQLRRLKVFDVHKKNHAAAFTDENLKQYAAVIFLSTADESNTLLNEAQKAAFMRFIQSGKGYVGVHAGSDALYNWPWYNKLVGAYFKNHPKPQEAELTVTDKNFIATKELPASWKHFDEWYNYKETNWDSVQVLLTVNEKSYAGGENGSYHPVCWYHNYDGGRSFFLGLGHTKECYTDPLFLDLLSGGIKYAITNRDK